MNRDAFGNMFVAILAIMVFVGVVPALRFTLGPMASGRLVLGIAACLSFVTVGAFFAIVALVRRAVAARNEKL